MALRPKICKGTSEHTPTDNEKTVFLGVDEGY